MVLAVLAAQVAPREEDCSRSAPTAQGTFLSVMRAVGGDARLETGTTRTQPFGAAVDAAIPGAKVAGPLMLSSPLGPCSELSYLKQGSVGGLGLHITHSIAVNMLA
jgi:hypothetical protein